MGKVSPRSTPSIDSWLTLGGEIIVEVSSRGLSDKSTPLWLQNTRPDRAGATGRPSRCCPTPSRDSCFSSTATFWAGPVPMPSSSSESSLWTAQTRDDCSCHGFGFAKTKSKPTPYTVSNASYCNTRCYPRKGPWDRCSICHLPLMLMRCSLTMRTVQPLRLSVSQGLFTSPCSIQSVQIHVSSSSCSRMYLTKVFLWVW